MEQLLRLDYFRVGFILFRLRLLLDDLHERNRHSEGHSSHCQRHSRHNDHHCAMVDSIVGCETLLLELSRLEVIEVNGVCIEEVKSLPDRVRMQVGQTHCSEEFVLAIRQVIVGGADQVQLLQSQCGDQY